MVVASSTDRRFYAVDPRIVLRTAKVFGITSSMLDKGAKRLHSRAVAILAGKEAGRWGRHQRSVIEQYCQYTQQRGSRHLLPWQELVEDRTRYDGKEGISSRTGNKPLATVVRLCVDRDALTRARTVKGLTVETLSEDSDIPQALLSAMESGDWPDVATSTAERIAASLDMPVAELFEPLNTGAAPTPTAGTRAQTQARGTPAIAAAAVLFLGVGILVGWTLRAAREPPMSTSPDIGVDVVAPPPPPSSDTSVSADAKPLVGCWRWSNGFTIVVNVDGSASNGFGIGRWTSGRDNRYEVDWPDIIGVVTLAQNGLTLDALDSLGVRSTATRLQGASDGFVGIWRWDNGSIVTVSDDGSISLGHLRGTWLRQGERFELTWPLDDEIYVAEGGNSLHGQNQFGAFTATRMETCP